MRCSDGEHEHELTVAYGVGPDGERGVKRMTADGAVVERLLDVDFRPLLAVFEPDRLELIKGAPAARRAHLDQLVAGIWPLRAAQRREYSRVLAQRNALLARIRSGRASQATLGAWDRELAVAALAVREHRAAAIELLAEPFRERAAQLGLNGEAPLVLQAALARAGRRRVRRRAAGAPAGRPRARLLRPRPASRRAGGRSRGPRAALLRLAG